MFGLFGKKRRASLDSPSAGVATPEGKPRGVLPAQVNESEVILCKAGPTVRDAYEIRLSLFMAKTQDKRFVLQVKPEAVVDDALVDLFKDHGGEVRRAEFSSYSVYIGCRRPDGKETGWTLGDERAMVSLRSALKSGWLREHLRVGAEIPFRELIQFGNELWEESLDLQNIDGENVKDALLALMVEAIQSEGALFIQ